MTYKELVNSVLDRLREDRVNTVTENNYSKLVGAFVNDAKRLVEDTWAWSVLLRSVNIPVTANVYASYDLEDYTTVEASDQLNERARLYIEPNSGCPLVRVTTDNRERDIEVVTQVQDFVNRKTQQNDSEAGEINAVYFSTNPSAVAGKTRLRMETLPGESDTSETIQVYLINPQNDLVSDDDVLQVPSDPVKQLAYLYCLYERGEELGEMLTVTSLKAESALSDAVQIDASQTSNPSFVVK